jgi:hypothetical protein
VTDQVPAPPAAPVPGPTWLERNWMHAGAWVGGAAAIAVSFYDVEWGRQMVGADPFILASGLGAFGLSVAYAAGVKVPAP